MTVSVGQQIAGGKLVVASVDTNDLVTVVQIPANTNPTTGEVPTITFTPAMTVAAIEALFA